VEREWHCPTVAGRLPLDQLDRVTIRYYFYYPEDRGIGGHIHDLEAIELQIRIEPVCLGNNCYYGALLESVAGSAHGVGWYTSVLDVFKTSDTVIPISALVEENKHASMPDRDADGLYMPHYDINRYSNDGWGIRDVAGTGTLGSPAYSADQSRVLRALHLDQRVLPPKWPQRLQNAYDAREAARSTAARTDTTELPRYEVRRSWTSPACDQGTRKADDEHLAAFFKDKRPHTPGKLTELVNHGGFCESMAVRSPFNLKVQRASDVTNLLYPGPRNQYGFMNWTDRLSVSYRNDRGHGISYAGPPIPGTEMPIFGGWLVGKANVILDGSSIGSASIDAMYTPSASRSASWYLALGREWSFGHEADRTESHVAEEFGLKFRFLAEGRLLKTFLGGRIGVRASGTDPIGNARLIFEVGTGSW
jgi:hypothetical protein